MARYWLINDLISWASCFFCSLFMVCCYYVCSFRKCQRFSPPKYRPPESKYIDYDEIGREHEWPWQSSAIISPTARNSTHQKKRIHYGHVWIQGRDSQKQAAAHCENETGDLQIEGHRIGAETGTPGLSEFLHLVDFYVPTIPTIPYCDLAPISCPGQTESFEHVVIIYVQFVAFNMFRVGAIGSSPGQELAVGL